MRFAIRYHLYDLKNVKNNHGGVLLFVRLQAWNFTKSITPPWAFFTFLNCTNCTKSCKTSQLLFAKLLETSYYSFNSHSIIQIFESKITKSIRSFQQEQCRMLEQPALPTCHLVSKFLFWNYKIIKSQPIALKFSCNCSYEEPIKGKSFICTECCFIWLSKLLTMTNVQHKQNVKQKTVVMTFKNSTVFKKYCN